MISKEFCGSTVNSEDTYKIHEFLIVRSDRFLIFEKVFLSLVSPQKDCLNFLHCLRSLCLRRQLLCSVRQPSFFLRPRKVKLSRGKKIGLHSRSLPGKQVPRQREYIFLGSLFSTSVTLEKLKSDVEKNRNKILFFLILLQII